MIRTTILRLNSLIIPPFGLLLNFTLLWLIIHRTPKEMWLHSRVLLQTCILDILLLVASFIAMPFATFLNEGHYLFLLYHSYLIQFGLFRPFFNDPMRLWFLFLFWHFFFHLDVIGLAVQFLYRHLILNRNVKITIYRYLFFLTVPLIASILINYISFYYDVKRILLNNSTEFSDISIDFNGNVTFLAFEMSDTSKIMMLAIALCYFLSYSIIIFCGRQMVKYVTAHAMHNRLKELNKQLTKSLIICASYPLIFQALILLFFLSSAFLSIVNEGFFVNLLLSWLPILNPLASLWTFRPYREALMAPFKKAVIQPIA